MNKDYWQDFYKENGIPNQRSGFAKFCLDYLGDRKIIIDVGCGNGRDSYYFAENGHNVIGIDYANEPTEALGIEFVKADFKDFYRWEAGHVLYSRFFLHSISKQDIRLLIEKSPRIFMAECRSIKDEPILYKHKRNLIDGNWLLRKLMANGFKIKYFKESTGLAKFKEEDPLIVRVVATK